MGGRRLPRKEALRFAAVLWTAVLLVLLAGCRNGGSGDAGASPEPVVLASPSSAVPTPSPTPDLLATPPASHVDARAWFEGKPTVIESSALRNSSLQGGYLILAARALGLDCGPMSGFDAARVDAAFWAGTAVKTNFVCTLGHGDPAKVMPRLPRLAFEDACRLL